MKIWQPRSARGAADLFLRNDPHAVGGDWDRVLDANGVRVADHWQPFIAESLEGEADGFVNIGSELVCDEQTWHIIRPHLQSDAEGLPIVADERLFFFVNVVRQADCLNLEDSNIIYSPLDGSVFDILRPVVRPEMLTGVMLFRLPQRPTRVYATDAFKNLVEAHRIQGIVFDAF